MEPWCRPFGLKVTTSGLSTGKLACATALGINFNHNSSWEPFVCDNRIGHGTHVAGTIAALDNDIGVIGVAPEAEIFVVKYFADESGFAYSSSLINAAYKCRDVGAKIISMSLGELMML
jgi:subtilisin family serine protease